MTERKAFYWPYGLVGIERVSVAMPKMSFEEALQTIYYWKEKYKGALLCAWIQESAEHEKTIWFRVYVDHTIFDDNKEAK